MQDQIFIFRFRHHKTNFYPRIQYLIEKPKKHAKS